MPSFAERIKMAIDTLRMKSTYDDGKYEFTEQELIEASSSAYHGIRDIRNSVLMNPVRSIFLVMGQQPQRRRYKSS
ncbi:unnamed protein product, partial [Rotaria sp. Silwood2]